jgi:condensin complex subunit 3
VRRTVVRCIGATRLTLPHILKRTKDVDESVRKAAFKFIADKIHIKSLTIAQREQVIQRGLSDRKEGVKSIVERDLGA